MTDAEMVAVIVGLTEVVKNFGLPSKYCSTFAILLGAGIGVSEEFRNGTQDIYGGIMKGILVGATTTGVYAATDKMISKTTNNTQNANIIQETH